MNKPIRPVNINYGLYLGDNIEDEVKINKYQNEYCGESCEKCCEEQNITVSKIYKLMILLFVAFLIIFIFIYSQNGKL